MTVADAVINILARLRFGANAAAWGWAISEDPPYDGTKQRFVFCIAVAVLVALVGVATVPLLHRANPNSRLAVMYALPAGVVVDLFTVVYSPGNVAANSVGESADAHARAADAFDRLFPTWFTGGHALLVVLLGILALRLIVVLRKPEHREFYEFAAA
ncbi:hypothetical protein [Dactylosporangium sp. NPDC051541]|uniref:hypothetical protein n=1 Tax=Dactylosporangium sp. NPDC051541 TaxID=3363977 RepID=UPI0037878174